jgi:hypothetical protein
VLCLAKRLGTEGVVTWRQLENLGHGERLGDLVAILTECHLIKRTSAPAKGTRQTESRPVAIPSWAEWNYEATARQLASNRQAKRRERLRQEAERASVSRDSHAAISISKDNLNVSRDAPSASRDTKGEEDSPPADPERLAELVGMARAALGDPRGEHPAVTARAIAHFEPLGYARDDIVKTMSEARALDLGDSVLDEIIGNAVAHRARTLAYVTKSARQRARANGTRNE